MSTKEIFNQPSQKEQKIQNESVAVKGGDAAIESVIQIAVKTQAVESEANETGSNAPAGIFAFSYTITIEHSLKGQITDRLEPENSGVAFIDSESLNELNEITPEGAVQLINRHWKVYSGNKQIADVKGEGVVGQLPLLRPGDSFEYTSWTILQDPVGYMEGAFTFRTDKGEFFDVSVPKLTFDYRERLNVH